MPVQPTNRTPKRERSKRAYKPKVRTGCITCKIRKVKCDEQKPACQRCLSTQRICDGYDYDNTSKSNESGLKKLMHQASTVQGLRILRPLIFDINGSETESGLFHKFKVAADIGLSLHVCDCTSFWNRLALQLAHQEDAVKHALIALGAAYYSHRAGETTTDHNGGVKSADLPVLTIVQYNRAVLNLRQLIDDQSSPRTVEIALVCCLLFIGLENLRSNHLGALNHLKNGLRIIVSLLDLEDCYGLIARRDAIPRDDNRTTSGSFLTRRDLQDVILQFRRSEVCASAFYDNIEPLVAIRLYDVSRFDDGRITYAGGFSSLAIAHSAAFGYTSDVYARAWEVRNYKGDDQFWGEPHVQLEQQCLRDRGRRLVAKYTFLMSSKLAPEPGTADYFSAYVDLILLKCTQIILERIPYRGGDIINMEELGASHESTFKVIIHFASLLQKVNVQASRKTCPLPDLGIVAPIYFVYTYSKDTQLKSKAVELLGQVCKQDGLWDARFLVKLLRRIEQTSQENVTSAGVASCHAGGRSKAQHWNPVLPNEHDDTAIAPFPSCIVMCIPN